MNPFSMYNQYITANIVQNTTWGTAKLNTCGKAYDCNSRVKILEIDEIENGETLPEGVDADDGEPKKKGDRAQIGVFTHSSFCPSLSL